MILHVALGQLKLSLVVEGANLHELHGLLVTQVLTPQILCPLIPLNPLYGIDTLHPGIAEATTAHTADESQQVIELPPFFGFCVIRIFLGAATLKLFEPCLRGLIRHFAAGLAKDTLPHPVDVLLLGLLLASVRVGSIHSCHHLLIRRV